MAVPDDKRSAQAGVYGRPGFTLIELMFALTFAVVIILVAAQAFRTIGATVNVVTAMNHQNRLLRSGFWSLIQQADYWDLEANTEVPWCKEWTRARRDASVAGSMELASLQPKRPFAPVVFAASGRDMAYLEGGAAGDELSLRPAQNPNVYLPHDSRQWHRNHLWGAGNPPGYYTANGDNANGAYSPIKGTGVGPWASSDLYDDGPDWSGLPPRLLWGDYGLHQATEMRLAGTGDVDGGGDSTGFDELNYRFRPLDWDGSLARDTNDDGDPTNDPLDDDDEDIDADPLTQRDATPWALSATEEFNAFVNAGRDPDSSITLLDALSARARGMLQYFQRLHYLGVFAYMPRGTALTVYDQRGDFLRGTSRPYQSDPRLTSTTADANHAWNAFLPRNPGDGGREWREEEVSPHDTQLRRYYYGGARDWNSVLGNSYKGVDNRCAFTLMPHRAAGVSVLGYADHKAREVDFDQHYREMPFVWTPTSPRDQSLINVSLPLHPAFLSTTYLLPQNVSDGIFQSVYLSTDGSRLVEQLGIAGDATKQQDLERELRSVNLQNRPSHMPVMKMEWLRMQGFGGALLNLGVIAVADRENGVRLRLRMSPFGSTYRGARQHWAQQWLRNGGTISLTSGGVECELDDDDNQPVGDF
ncbi:MAG: PilW family protein, partial [Chloroflexota bacterium]